MSSHHAPAPSRRPSGESSSVLDTIEQLPSGAPAPSSTASPSPAESESSSKKSASLSPSLSDKITDDGAYTPDIGASYADEKARLGAGALTPTSAEAPVPGARPKGVLDGGHLSSARRAELLERDATLSALAPVQLKMVDFFLPKSSRHRSVTDIDAVATQPSVFDDPALSKHYWPSEKWENYKNWDVNLRWTWREEREVVRLIDRKVMIWVCVFFAVLNLDRNNLSAANSDGILKDLHLTTDDYNNANMIFRLTFLFAELPGQIISKRIGPDVFVPMQMLAWGIVTLAQYWLSGRTSFLVLRGLLGLCQGSMIPDLLLLLSYFYRTSELPIRLGLFWVTMNATSFFSAFFSYGVLQMRGILGKPGWRWLFMVEGLITVVLGIIAFLVMPASPSQTKRIYTKRPWLNERQTKIAVARVLRDEPQKSTMTNRQGLSAKQIWRVTKNWRLYPLYLHGLLFSIPLSPVQAYLTLSLRRLGFSTLLTQVLSSVQYAAAMFTGIAVVILSEVVNDRLLVCSLEDLWVLPCLIGIVALGKNVSPWTYYSLATVLLSAPYVHPIQASVVSAISGDVQTRTVAASLYNITVQLGSVVSSQVYQAKDAPQYLPSNIALICIAAANICAYGFSKTFYKRMNARRDRIWNGMSTEEKEHYLATTKDEGNERLDFRFIH